MFSASALAWAELVTCSHLPVHSGRLLLVPPPELDKCPPCSQEHRHHDRQEHLPVGQVRQSGAVQDDREERQPKVVRRQAHEAGRFRRGRRDTNRGGPLRLGQPGRDFCGHAGS